MINLNQIFPENYPDIPTMQDIQVIFNDILNRSDSVLDIVCQIDKQACPYYKHTLVLYLADQLDDWYRKHRELVGFQQGNNWIAYWKEPKDEIKYYIEKYQKEAKTYTYTATAPPTKSTPKVVTNLKSSLQQVVTELSAIKNVAQHTHITINMPIYIIQGDNNGTFAGEQITNNYKQL